MVFQDTGGESELHYLEVEHLAIYTCEFAAMDSVSYTRVGSTSSRGLPS